MEETRPGERWRSRELPLFPATGKVDQESGTSLIHITEHMHKPRGCTSYFI